MFTYWKALLLLVACSALLPVWTCSAAAAQPSNGVAAIHPARSMWIWNTKQLLLDDVARNELFRFAAEPKGPGSAPIRRFFLSVSWAIAPTATPLEREALRAFLIEAHQQGIAIDLLAGAPRWAATPLDPALQQLLNNMADWQRQEQKAAGLDSQATATFDGLQLDVEPYLLTGWPSDSHFAGWTGMAEQVRFFLDAHPDLRLSFGLAIPIWLDQEKYQFLNKPLQAASDYVALMDYRDTAARIVRDATTELEVAQQLGRLVFVGVDTKDVKGDPPSVTFFQEGNAAMERELLLAGADLVKHPSFAGYAIHHYDTYRLLKP